MYFTKPGLLVGFHGCDFSVRDKIINHHSHIHSSKNEYDWLGNGIYFWENNIQRALEFAEDIHKNPRRSRPPIKNPTVLGALLDLGFCLDLLDKEYIILLSQSYDILKSSYSSLDLELPGNRPLGQSRDLLLRKLDCAVIENLHLVRKQNKLRPFDSVRGVFIEGEPLYPSSGFHEKSHIQLCIRNPNCIKGFFIPREADSKWIIP